MRSLRFPHFWSCLTWQVVLSHSMRWGLKKVLLIRFIPQVQIIFSVLIKSSHAVSTGGTVVSANAGGWLLPTPRTHTTESGHHRIDTRTVWTLSVDSFAAPIKQTRGQDCVLSSWNGLVGTKPPTKCSSTSAVCRRIAPNCRCHSPALGIENGLHWILDVTFGEDACTVRSPCTPQSGTVTSLCRQCAQSSRLKQTKPQAEVSAGSNG